MSLRPPLHVSTFHSRTVVSMFGRLCHLLVPCAIQLTSGERPVYDSTFSSSLSSRSARKTQVRSRKKTAERKKTRLAAGKKRLAAGKSCFRSGKKRQQKMPLRSGKKSKQQKKHLAAAQKHLCSRKNTFWRQREKTVRGGKKPVRGKKKTGRGRKKTSSRESPALQPKKLPQRKKYISATGKSSSPFHTGVITLSSMSADDTKTLPSCRFSVFQIFFFRPTPDGSPGRLSSRKDNCIVQIHRINAVATLFIMTMLNWIDT